MKLYRWCALTIAGCSLARGAAAQELAGPASGATAATTVQTSPASTPSAPEPAAQDQQQPEFLRKLPLLVNADEFGLNFDLEYYEPEPGFNREDRDIDVGVARAALFAHFRQGWEFQFDVLVLRAHGTAVLSSTPPIPPPVPANAVAVGAGPMVRWNYLQLDRMRFFVDGEGDLFIADRNFPPHGSSYDFFLRAGGGISYRVSDLYWVEAAYRVAHISNAQGFGASNPTWNGRGLSLSLRRTFRPYRRESEDDSVGKSAAAAHREKSWTTSVENYWATPGTNLQGTNVAHQLRALRIARSWQLPKGFEWQLGGLVGRATHVPQADEIAGFGALVRWDFLRSEHWRPFVEGGADLLQTGSPAFVIPLGGVGYNFLVRTDAGASVRLHGAYWLEASYRFGYVTDGFGPGGGAFPAWSGQGPGVGLRRTFH